MIAGSAATLAIVVVGCLDPDFLARHVSVDGVLSDHTRTWLARYRGAVTIGAALSSIITVLAWRARHSPSIQRLDAMIPRIALAMVATAVAVTGAEWVCRLVESERARASATRDAAAFARGFMKRIEAQLNADGFRDDPFDRPRAAGEARVLVIGDSFAFGFGVDDRASTFPARLEAELRAFAPVDVFNAAVPGADTARELEVARATIDRVDPDLVLIAWHVNDAESEADKRAYVEQSRALPLISDVLLRHSAAWRVIEPALVTFAIARGWKRSYVEQLRALHDPPTGTRWSQRHEFESLLDESLHDEAQRGGRRAAVVFFPLVEDFANYPLRDVHGVVARACEARGIATLDLLDVFVRESAESLQVDAFDHHLNPKGNALAAKAVAGFVRASDLLSKR